MTIFPIYKVVYELVYHIEMKTSNDNMEEK